MDNREIVCEISGNEELGECYQQQSSGLFAKIEKKKKDEKTFAKVVRK